MNDSDLSHPCRPGPHSRPCSPLPGARGSFPCACGCKSRHAYLVTEVCEAQDEAALDHRSEARADQ